MEEKLIHDLLIEVDSPEKYCPADFSFFNEDQRAATLAGRIESSLPVKALVQDYSANQDGSLFLDIQLHSTFSLTTVAIIHISCFGGLVTIDSLNPAFQVAPSLLDEARYVYVPRPNLDGLYDGKYRDFLGLTWYQRYFSPWYMVE